MFIVDAAVLLPHPPRTVARVVGRLYTLPRWCAGLRRVRRPAHAGWPGPAPRDRPIDARLGADGGAGCILTYGAADVRLTLRAHTRPRAPGEAATLVEHVAAGDGLSLTWALSVTPEPRGAPEYAGGGPQTRLRARTTVVVEPGHPTAAVRAALCRVVARRAPADLERLRALLARYAAGQPRGGVARATALPVPVRLPAAEVPAVGVPDGMASARAVS